MSRASDLLSFLNEKHNVALVQYKLEKSDADEVVKLRKMFLPHQLDTKEEENQSLPPHVTIFYGLDDSDLSVVGKALENFGKLSYRIKSKPIIFDNPEHDVLVLPLESDDFGRLHKYISKITGKVPPTFREYKPHCTISYLKKGTPYKHVKLPHDIEGTTNVVEFSDTNDTGHIINLGNK